MKPYNMPASPIWVILGAYQMSVLFSFDSGLQHIVGLSFHYRPGRHTNGWLLLQSLKVEIHIAALSTCHGYFLACI